MRIVNPMKRIGVNSSGRRIAFFTAILAFAAVAAAQKTSIQLPPDNPAAQLKAGPDEPVVRRDCGICHSTDYIVIQPHLDAEHWNAEVKKMITVYGAPVSEGDAKIISDYLARNYGSGNAESKGTEPAKP